jgi:hypothetical protein
MTSRVVAYLNPLSFLAVCVCSPLIAVAADFDYAAYKRATIPEILERHEATECRPTAPRESVYSAYAYKYRFITVFSRELRPISEETKEFLRRYGKAFRWNQDVVESYKHEFLVRDGGKDYWVPVQDPLLPAMGQELKKGQRFELYIAVLGATHNRCLFVATEFDATPK